MIACLQCDKVEAVVKAGFIRGNQRYYCKLCRAHFTIPAERQATGSTSRFRQPTLQDIAKPLGLSVSTVSRALQNHPNIHPNTRQAVLELARQLDYKPNPLALSLIKHETRMIGVIIPDIERPFFASVINGIQHMAQPAGYRVIITQSDESYATEVSNVEALVASRVDGMLICQSKETSNYEHFSRVMNKGFPVVFYDRVCPELPSSKVTLDNVESARKVVAHLIGQGCRRIAILTGPAILQVCQDRLQGYVQAHQEAGLPIDEQLIIWGHFNEDTALAAARFWLDMEDRPDGVFCVYDQGAVSILKELRRRGLSIPGDVCLAGMGNDPFSSIIEPGLTSLHQFPLEMGRMAANLLLRHLTSPEPPSHLHQSIAGELIVRQSSLKNG